MFLELSVILLYIIVIIFIILGVIAYNRHDLSGPTGPQGGQGQQGNQGPQGIPGNATNTGATGPNKTIITLNTISSYVPGQFITFNGQSNIESQTSIVMNSSGTLSNLIVRNTPLTSTSNMTINVRKNGVNTNLTAFFNGGGFAFNNNAIVPFVTGDVISVQYDPNSDSVNNSGQITYNINTT